MQNEHFFAELQSLPHEMKQEVVELLDGNLTPFRSDRIVFFHESDHFDRLLEIVDAKEQEKVCRRKIK